MNLDPAELLAVYAIVSTSRAPRAKRLARRVLEAYEAAPREDRSLVTPDRETVLDSYVENAAERHPFGFTPDPVRREMG